MPFLYFYLFFLFELTIVVIVIVCFVTFYSFIPTTSNGRALVRSRIIFRSITYEFFAFGVRVCCFFGFGYCSSQILPSNKLVMDLLDLS